MSLDRLIYSTDEWLFLLMTIALQLLVSQIGFLWGQRRREWTDETIRNQIFSLQAALFGMVSIMMAFSFSIALDRHETRRKVLVDEANAISTAYQLTDLLPSPEAGQIRQRIQAYTQARIDFSNIEQDPGALESVSARSESQLSQIWALLITSLHRVKDPATRTLTGTAFNNLSDLHTARKAALQNRMPAVVVLLLFLMILLTMAAFGYGWGVVNDHHMTLRVIVVLLLALSLTLVIDLDRPARGWILVSQKPLLDLQNSLGR